ncbi:MAG: hypothetical protein CM1200mP41_14500 [Gammaproteobacteria bacterium]|nr:MAG: hypothetical protein CM1200mP41_14500 [Gammaproteobacteria bacterium]
MWADRTIVGVTIGVVLIAVANFLVPDWIRQIGLLSMAIGSVALGLLVLWRSGLISFGHALFYGFSAYGVALLNYLGIRDAFVLVIVSAAASGLLAWGLGFLVRRYRAIFFALLTMAFSMILYGVLAKTERFGSTDGLNVHPPTFLGYAPGRPGSANHTVPVLFAGDLCLDPGRTTLSGFGSGANDHGRSGK